MMEDPERELPPAEPAEGLSEGGGLDNDRAKRRQNMLWAGVTALVGIPLCYFAWQYVFTDPSQGVDTEQAARVSATADLVRGGNLSGSAQAEELAVRVRSLDAQLGELNNQNVELSSEAEALRQQLESERADALATIEALNRSVQQNNQGSSAAMGPVAGPQVGEAPGIQASGASQIYVPSDDPFAPAGAGGRAQVAGAMGEQAPRRTLSTVRVSSAGADAATPRASGGGQTEGAPGSTGPGGYMSSSMQVFESDRFVPPNAYVTARVLVGVDAATGVTTNADPKPVLFRLTGPAVHVGSDGRFQTTDLTGCVVNGAAYGELSSEKVYVRLQRITCPAGGRQFSVATVEGYASHMGKAGVRGAVISREGGLTGRAMIAGTLQGLGSSLSNYADSMSQTIGVGPGGGLVAPPTPEAGDVAAGAAGAGVANAASMLADYYVKRAEQYQPVIEMPTGIEVELVFLSGFEISRQSR